MEQGIINLRHLGGHLNKDGKKIKDNLLFRSGNLNINPQKLKEILKNLNIKTVYDLRSSYEVQKEGYVLPNNIRYKHYPVLNSLERYLDDMSLDLTSSNEAFNLIHDINFMIDINREMALNPFMFGEIIKDIIDLNGKPVLFHCSAGKDRTGILSALLLLGLDFGYDDIIKDYLLSNEHRKGDIEAELEKLKKAQLPEAEIKQIKDMLMVKEEYLNAFLDVVKKYDSFEIYAKEKLGLNNNDLKKLQELFLK